MNFNKAHSGALMLLLLMGLGIGSLHACNVPVFRYALERWDADIYHVLVVHGPEGLSESEQAACDLIKQCSISDTAAINLDIYQYSRDKVMDSQFRALFPNGMKQTDSTTIHLFHPLTAGESGPIWTAPLTLANVHRLLADPDRLELLNKITSGTSVIMLMLESGNPEADEAAWERLSEGIQATSEYLGLPEGIVLQDGSVADGGRPSMDPADRLWSTIPLKLEFGLQRVKKTKANSVLRQCLLSVDPELLDKTDSPMVFPVFGRGRFIYPMVGDEITEENVLYASHYVCGACSCEIKAQNPGMELPILMDWEAIFYEKEPVLTMEQFIDSSETGPEENPGKSISIDLEISNRSLGIGFIFFGILALGGIIVFIKRRLS